MCWLLSSRTTINTYICSKHKTVAWCTKHIIFNMHGASSLSLDDLDESVVGLDWNQSQSRSLMMSSTQENWQLFCAWRSRWAGPLCVFTRPTLKPTRLLHPVCVFCQCSRVDRTLLHHSAFFFFKASGHSLSLSPPLTHLSFGWKMSTYVAPTCRNCRKAGVNWYRTKRPALGSQCFLPPAKEERFKRKEVKK